MSGLYTLRIQQGIGETRTFTWRNRTTRAVIDMTNWTITDCKILRSVPSQAVEFTPTTAILAPATQGKFTITWTAEQSDTLEATANNSYVWYIDLKNIVTLA